MALRGGRTVGNDELVSIVADILAHQSKPVVTVKNVSEQVNLTDDQIRDRLNTLADEGALNQSLLGNDKLTIYWLPESSDAASDDSASEDADV